MSGASVMLFTGFWKYLLQRKWRKQALELHLHPKNDIFLHLGQFVSPFPQQFNSVKTVSNCSESVKVQHSELYIKISTRILLNSANCSSDSNYSTEICRLLLLIWLGLTRPEIITIEYLILLQQFILPNPHLIVILLITYTS